MTTVEVVVSLLQKQNRNESWHHTHHSRQKYRHRQIDIHTYIQIDADTHVIETDRNSRRSDFETYEVRSTVALGVEGLQ